MKISIRKGFGFGLTSGIITTLGLMIGLNAGTGSRFIILAGVLTIAIADAFSDSMGVHISEESGQKNITKKEIWESTFATFFSKMIFALSFVIPILFLQLNIAILVSAVWGISLITIFSFYLAKVKEASPLKIISEHLIITVIVIILTNYTGILISNLFA